MSETATPAQSTVLSAEFEQPNLIQALGKMSPAELDTLDFGAIGIDDEGIVRQYNAYESKAAGLSPDRVLERPLFTVVAPCMNNFMVAHRFDEAAESNSELDEFVNYVLTLKMRPTKVRLRLLAISGAPMRYVLVQRKL